jgi:hypothetical protein
MRLRGVLLALGLPCVDVLGYLHISNFARLDVQCRMVEALLLATYCLICWKIGWTKAPADEALCVVLGTSYEVETQEAVAQAASIGVILGDISHSEDNTDLEKELEMGAAAKPP